MIVRLGAVAVLRAFIVEIDMVAAYFARCKRLLVVVVVRGRPGSRAPVERVNLDDDRLIA